MNGFIVDREAQFLSGGRKPKLTTSLERAKVYRYLNHAKSAIKCHDLKGAQVLRVSLHLEEAIPCD